MPDSDESKREVRADNRDTRADARDDRAGARETRADVREVAADDREVRVDTREVVAGEREEHVEALLDRLVRILKFFGFLAVVLTVLAAGNFIRSFASQDAADKAVAAAERVEGMVANGTNVSQATLDELRAIIAASKNSGDSASAAISAINRIEFKLCGGPCPPVPSDDTP